MVLLALVCAGITLKKPQIKSYFIDLLLLQNNT